MACPAHQAGEHPAAPQPDPAGLRENTPGFRDLLPGRDTDLALPPLQRQASTGPAA